MDDRLVELHKKTGLVCGEEKTCGIKVVYECEEDASRSALALSKKGISKYELEAYPCPFCNKWHVGRKMSREELEKWEKIYDELGSVS